MFYIVYKTTNLINHKIYIGTHKTKDLNDDYLGSGVFLKKAIKKYGKNNFKKEIIAVFDNAEDMMKEERKIVNKNFILRKDTYNYELGGKGGKIWTDDLRQKMSESKKGHIPWNKGLKTGNFMTEEEKQKRSQKMSGKNNHMFGINVSSIIDEEKDKERRRKISESNKKPKTKTDGYKKYASNRFWIVDIEGNLCHACSENDERLVSGKFKRGRKWK